MIPSPLAMAPRPSFPDHAIAGLAGASFKPQHLNAILEDTPAGLFFEVHAENYMGAGGMPHAALAGIRSRFPLSLHGVCMSIGGENPLDEDHLARVVVERHVVARDGRHGDVVECHERQGIGSSGAT